MNIKVSTKLLQEVLDLVSRFVSKHSTLPVLENVYIKGHIDSLVFRATDMEKYIDITLPMKLDNEGAITVNAKTLGDIVRVIDDTEVDLTIDETNDIMYVKSTSDDFKIKGIPATEYVAVPQVLEQNMVNIDLYGFSKGISKVEYAVTERNFSPVLTGVLLRLKKYADGNKLVFVGTDSFRLAEYKMNFDGETANMDIILPKMNIGDIKKVADYALEKGGEKMKISFSENLASFSSEFGGIKILATSLLIQGNFPDYENENIMPSQFNSKIMLDKDSLDKAIRKMSIFTREINNFIDVSVEGNSLLIKSGETEKGEAKTSISALVEGEKMNFGINGKYVLEYVKALDGNEITINIVNPERPMVFKDKDDENYTYVVRPLVK